MANNSQVAYHYDTALIPPQFVICGVKLKPFCLGHFLILRQLQSPLSCEIEKSVDSKTGILWFFHALLVCALSYEDNLELLNDDKLFGDTCKTFSEKLMENMQNDPSWNIYEKLALFKKYMAWFMEMPIFDEEQDPGKKSPSGIDWCQNIFTIFKSHLGYTETEILNMSFRKLFFEWCSFAEENGAIKVWNKSTLQSYMHQKGML